MGLDEKKPEDGKGDGCGTVGADSCGLVVQLRSLLAHEIYILLQLLHAGLYSSHRFQLLC